jgi:hypothetical protein
MVKQDQQFSAQQATRFRSLSRGCSTTGDLRADRAVVINASSVHNPILIFSALTPREPASTIDPSARHA